MAEANAQEKISAVTSLQMRVDELLKENTALRESNLAHERALTEGEHTFEQTHALQLTQMAQLQEQVSFAHLELAEKQKEIAALESLLVKEKHSAEGYAAKSRL